MTYSASRFNSLRLTEREYNYNYAHNQNMFYIAMSYQGCNQFNSD